MAYVAAFSIGVVFTIVLFCFQDMKDSWINRKANRRHQLLLNGIPKRAIFLNGFDDLIRYREYPFYIEGKTYSISRLGHITFDERYTHLVDKDGNTLGYIHSLPMSRYVDVDGKRYVKYGLSLSDSPNSYGKVVSISAVVQVY